MYCSSHGHNIEHNKQFFEHALLKGIIGKKLRKNWLIFSYCFSGCKAYIEVYMQQICFRYIPLPYKHAVHNNCGPTGYVETIT